MKKELHLHLTDMVDYDNCRYLSEAIIKANNDKAVFEDEYFFEKSKSSDIKIEKIFLHICSGGGYCDPGMQLMNVISASKIPVTAVVSSAYSMAFMITQACQHRQMYKHAKMMHHDTAGGEFGKLENMKENLKVMEIDRKIMDEIVMNRTNLTATELKKINKTKQDRYFFADEALEKGLVDEII